MKIKPFVFLFLAMLFFITGCSKQSSTNVITTHTLTAEDVHDTMFQALDWDIANGNTADRIYSLPSEEWIENIFAQSYSEFLTSIKSGGYVSEENDCDKFSVLAYAYAHILHHNTPNKIQKTGLTFGEFWYIRDSGGGHAINIAIVKDHETNKVIFFEPQTRQIVILSSSEKRSCSFWRF